MLQGFRSFTLVNERVGWVRYGVCVLRRAGINLPPLALQLQALFSTLTSWLGNSRPQHELQLPCWFFTLHPLDCRHFGCSSWNWGKFWWISAHSCESPSWIRGSFHQFKSTNFQILVLLVKPKVIYIVIVDCKTWFMRKIDGIHGTRVFVGHLCRLKLRDEKHSRHFCANLFLAMYMQGRYESWSFYQML